MCSYMLSILSFSIYHYFEFYRILIITLLITSFEELMTFSFSLLAALGTGQDWWVQACCYSWNPIKTGICSEGTAPVLRTTPQTRITIYRSRQAKQPLSRSGHWPRKSHWNVPHFVKGWSSWIATPPLKQVGNLKLKSWFCIIRQLWNEDTKRWSIAV